MLTLGFVLACSVFAQAATTQSNKKKTKATPTSSSRGCPVVPRDNGTVELQNIKSVNDIKRILNAQQGFLPVALVWNFDLKGHKAELKKLAQEKARNYRTYVNAAIIYAMEDSTLSNDYETLGADYAQVKAYAAKIVAINEQCNQSLPPEPFVCRGMAAHYFYLAVTKQDKKTPFAKTTMTDNKYKPIVSVVYDDLLRAYQINRNLTPENVLQRYQRGLGLNAQQNTQKPEKQKTTNEVIESLFPSEQTTNEVIESLFPKGETIENVDSIVEDVREELQKLFA